MMISNRLSSASFDVRRRRCPALPPPPVTIFRAFLAFLFVASSSVVYGQSCDINQVIDDILTCYGDNPCTCFNCDTTNNDNLPEPSFDGTTAITCDELNQLVCPDINCCSACANIIQDFLQCTVVDTFGLLGVFGPGQTCTINCNGFDFVDELDPNCDPADYVCVELYADYLSCYTGCEPTPGCSTNTGSTFGNAQLDETIGSAIAGNDDECSVINAIACPSDGSPLDDCCPQCDVYLANYFQCQSNLSFDTPCNVACATDEVGGGTGGNAGTTPSPVVGPTEAPAVVGTPTPDGSSPPSSGWVIQRGGALVIGGACLNLVVCMLF